jgi:heterodisulfide reductase subunit B
MTSAVGSGAELIVTSCPLCQYNLDNAQDKVALTRPGYRPVPIVYFTQILGLALDQPEATLGLGRNRWDVRPLLKEKGILS